MRLPARLALLAAPLIILCTTLAYAKNYVPIMVGDIVVFIPQDTPPEPKADMHTFNFSAQGGLHQLSHESNTLNNDEGISGLAEVIVDILPYAPIPGVDLIRSSATQIQYDIQPGYVGQFSYKYRLKYKFRSTESEYHYSSPTDVFVTFRPSYIPPGNRAPTANTDRASIILDQQFCNLDAARLHLCKINIDLLGNDSDPDSDHIQFVKLIANPYLSGPTELNGKHYDNSTYRGLINLQTNGVVTYIPGTKFFDPNNNSHYAIGPQEDTFDYVVVDSFGQTGRGLVHITLSGSVPEPEPEPFLQPVVKTFRWEPAIVAVGQPTTFHWDIENVKGCYGNGKPRGASGTSGPHTYSNPEEYTTDWVCTTLDDTTFNLKATRNVVSSNANLPVVKQFEWKPAVVAVGEGSTFHWNIENIKGCIGKSEPRLASGTSGPWTHPTPGILETNWTCTALDNSTFNLSANRVVRAINTGDSNLLGTLKWEPNELIVGHPVRLSWNFTNASSCTVTGPAINGTAPLHGSQTYTPYSIGDIVSKWQCKNSQGTSLTPREVILKVKPLASSVLRKK
ncbi:hypothetical protein GCM10009092_01120 [Bowmanella denitrificans]|uniref:Ig-like domain-containing protein n=1 Tax=Bowmanella denitrificans TaxID=366582 RepID=A0ABP3G9W6_9ALTE